MQRLFPSIISILIFFPSCYGSSGKDYDGQDDGDDISQTDDEIIVDHPPDDLPGDYIFDHIFDIPEDFFDVVHDDHTDPQQDEMTDTLPDGQICYVDSDCYDGSFCEFLEGVCGPPGICEWRGSGSCAISDEGVMCGCNNVIYRDNCTRKWAGISLKNTFICEGGGECYEGAPSSLCGVDNEFCNSTMGNCGDEDAISWCEIKPEGECSRDYEPVCGCDGLTYDNLCHLRQAGVWRRYNGECPDG